MKLPLLRNWKEGVIFWRGTDHVCKMRVAVNLWLPGFLINKIELKSITLKKLQNVMWSSFSNVYIYIFIKIRNDISNE